MLISSVGCGAGAGAGTLGNLAGGAVLKDEVGTLGTVAGTSGDLGATIGGGVGTLGTLVVSWSTFR